jgi:hypothetical protein
MKAETFIPPQIKHETMSFDVNERGSNGGSAHCMMIIKGCIITNTQVLLLTAML